MDANTPPELRIEMIAEADGTFGAFVIVKADGTVMIDWYRVEAAANQPSNTKMAPANFDGVKMKAIAQSLIAVRDKTYKPIEETDKPQSR